MTNERAFYIQIDLKTKKYKIAKLNILSKAKINSNLFLTSAVRWCPSEIPAGYARENHALGHPVSRIRLNRDGCCHKPDL